MRKKFNVSIIFELSVFAEDNKDAINSGMREILDGRNYTKAILKEDYDWSGNPIFERGKDDDL